MGVTRKEKLLKAMLEDNAAACGGGVTREERILASVSKKVCDNDALEGGGTGGGGSGGGGGGTVNLDGVLRYDQEQSLTADEQTQALANAGIDQSDVLWIKDKTVGSVKTIHNFTYDDNNEYNVVVDGEIVLYHVCHDYIDIHDHGYLGNDQYPDAGLSAYWPHPDDDSDVMRIGFNYDDTYMYVVNSSGAEYDGYTFPESGVYAKKEYIIFSMPMYGVKDYGTFNYICTAEIKKLPGKYLDDDITGRVYSAVCANGENSFTKEEQKVLQQQIGLDHYRYINGKPCGEEWHDYGIVYNYGEGEDAEETYNVMSEDGEILLFRVTEEVITATDLPALRWPFDGDWTGIEDHNTHFSFEVFEETSGILAITVNPGGDKIYSVSVAGSEYDGYTFPGVGLYVPEEVAYNEDGDTWSIHALYKIVNVILDERYLPERTSFIMKSSTEGSTKKFRVTVDDNGTLTATEVTE